MEWLEAGPTPPRGPRRLGWVAVVSVVALLVGGLFVSGFPGGSAGGPPTPTSAASSRQPLEPSTRRSTQKDTPQVQQSKISGFLTGTDLDLFARTEDHLYRIQTKSQTVTATALPNLSSDGALTFIADRGQVIVKGWSPGDGFRVVDGRTAQPLSDALRNADQVLPGPLGRLWVTQYRGQYPFTKLTDLNGRPVAAASGTSQYDLDGLQSDGHRGLLLINAGGVYELRPDGVRRLARGFIAAVGVSHILVTDCDKLLRCSRYLIDRRDGSSRRVGAALTGDTVGGGTISADGHYAALTIWSRQTTEVRFVDLRTGRTLAVLPDASGITDPGSLIWLPDDRLVGVVNQRLVVFDPESRRVTTPDLPFGALVQITLRD